MQERIWYKARLLPAANSIFTDAFYPEPAKRTGNRYVWFTEVSPAPNSQKVIVASRFASNSFRMLTLELAKHCIEPKSKATKAQIKELNKLSEHLEAKI
jgi:hypothetical protein